MAKGEPKTIGQRIKQLRLRQGLSQKLVAEPAMTNAYLSLIESDQRTPSHEMVLHIADRLGVEAEELLTGRPSGLGPRLELAVQEARRLLHRGESDAAVRSLESVAEAAGRYELRRLRAKALTLIATVLIGRDLDAARDMLDESLRLLRNEPAHLKFEAMVGLARWSHMSGDTRMAVYLLENYLVELKATGFEDPTARMRVYSALVQYYRGLGMNRRAIESATEATTLSSIVDDPEQIACMSMNIAQVLFEDGRADDAIEALRRAELVFQSLEWPLPATRAKINLGIVQYNKGNLPGARATFELALQEMDRFPTEQGVRAEVLNELARVERLMGEYDDAIEHLNAARKLLSKSDLVERGLNSREMALCLSESDPDSAEKEFKRATRYYQDAGAASEAAKCLLDYGRLLRAQGRDREAASVFEEGLIIAAPA